MTNSKGMHELGKVIIACETYITNGGKVLMHKRAENKKNFPGFWIGPGGHVDEEEDVLGAAIREVKEEVGIALDPHNIKLKVIAFHHHIDRNEVWVEYVFRATIPKEIAPKDSEEGVSQWIAIAEVLRMDNIFPPAKYHLDHILNDKPGILYNSSQWKGAQLYKICSERIGNI
ncbi:MAG: NUDIX domain-containing protein [Patescibacteria group bacterium]|nr:NUDIX domain-containing protein [Patescibacteria group bacterium]